MKSLKALENDLENRLEELINLKYLIAIKAEFEAEGTRIDELAILSELCCKFKVPFTLKVGGPSAQRDFYEAFQLGANKILVPMVESDFSLSRSVAIYLSFLNLFKDLENYPKLSFNVETYLAIKNIDKIIQYIQKEDVPITEIVLGRTDLSRSLGIVDVNSNEIFNFSKNLLSKFSNSNINFTVGGNLGIKSFEFIKNLFDCGLFAFESRKCTFQCTGDLNRTKFKQIIKKSLKFELSWLNYKKKLYSDRSEEENIRIETITNRLKD